jgi:hypothetical protein
MNVFLVVPTIRSLEFLRSWKKQFIDCSLVVIEDHAKREITTPSEPFKKIYHYTWEDIQKDFGTDEWIFPRHNAGIRSYGFWKAYTSGADVIITLDDDCFPVEEGFVAQHLDNLKSKAPLNWFATFPHPSYMFARGFPYDVRGKERVVLSHGLWSNKMDMDAKTQLEIGEVNIPAYPSMRQFVPKGYFFPMSSMNLAFSREVVPLMYFPLMGTDPGGKQWGFDRYDDIWAGIFVKKVLDQLGLAATNGSPFVEHKKASDPQVNKAKEKTGMHVNEQLWKAVAAVDLTETTPKNAMTELVSKVVFPRGEYFSQLKKAYEIWLSKF